MPPVSAIEKRQADIARYYRAKRPDGNAALLRVRKGEEASTLSYLLPKLRRRDGHAF
ncbi:MAG: hypothetical protein ACLR17_11515 [Enterobacteriaceae bacterium]